MRCLRLFLVGTLLGAPLAQAQATTSGRPDEPFDFMNLLSDHGLHDIDEERWNAYGQFTFISSWKLGFGAKYTNLNGSTNSLSSEPELSFTASATLFLGVKLWPGAEAYLVPEVIAERPLSQLRGLGGAIQNFELQKTGGEEPQLYRSRLYLRQTFGLGGDAVQKTSNPMQLGTTVDSRRLVLTLGNFSILDFFDRNSFNSDPRQQFLNMAFMTYAAYDFASDARGYTWGGTAELYFDDWALRIGRISPPAYPNQLEVNLRIDQYYGDQIELEHTHTLFGQAGAVRVLAYRNRALMGRFDEAISAFQTNPANNATTCPGFNYGSQNATAPDLCWSRKVGVKLGIGINLEQHLTEDVGVFFRGMYSDGESEVQAYTSSDRSIAFGAEGRGALWHRPNDVAGIGLAIAWISPAHAEYLRLGGIDGFIGDGTLTPAAETAFEIFYSVSFLRAVWLTLDYQHIANPAFNADRGAVDILAGRVHVEL